LEQPTSVNWHVGKLRGSVERVAGNAEPGGKIEWLE
jgi:hypothetical protein